MSRFTSADPSMFWLIDRLHDEGVLDAGQHDRLEGAILASRRKSLKREMRVREMTGLVASIRRPGRLGLWWLNVRARRRGDTLNPAARKAMAR